MSPFRKGKAGIIQIYVASRAGFKQRSTGTTIAAEARKMARMCEALKDAQEWALLDRVLASKLTLRDLYAHYVANTLDELKARYSGIDLAEYLDAWSEWVVSNGGTQQTADTYRSQVETLIGESFPLAGFTTPAVSKWLTELPKITTGTRRKYLYALKSFVAYLTESGITESDPTLGVKTPKKNKARLRYELEGADKRIVEAAPEDYRALFAFIKSTGAEVSAALSTIRRDLDLEQGLAHIRGSKNERRNRHDAIIEAWALPILKAHCRTFTDNAPVWPTITRYTAHDQHQATCKVLGIEDYTLRDARHSWAVRARKRGESLEAIAEQLGHKSILMAATVYAVFKPTLAERKQTRLHG